MLPPQFLASLARLELWRRAPLQEKMLQNFRRFDQLMCWVIAKTCVLLVTEVHTHTHRHRQSVPVPQLSYKVYAHEHESAQARPGSLWPRRRGPPVCAAQYCYCTRGVQASKSVQASGVGRLCMEIPSAEVAVCIASGEHQAVHSEVFRFVPRRANASKSPPNLLSEPCASRNELNKAPGGASACESQMFDTQHEDSHSEHIFLLWGHRRKQQSCPGQVEAMGTLPGPASPCCTRACLGALTVYNMASSCLGK